MKPLLRMLADDSGVAVVQYAVITAVLSVAMIGALATIVTICTTTYGTTSTNLSGLGTSPP